MLQVQDYEKTPTTLFNLSAHDVVVRIHTYTYFLPNPLFHQYTLF